MLCGLVLGCQLQRNSEQLQLPARANETLRVATYNVHYIVMTAERGPWSLGDCDRRKGPLDSAFKAMSADLVAFQEMESFARGSFNDTNLALDWLLEHNPDYAAAAVGPADQFPSTQPILYRKKRLAVQDQGWFFFSETPDVIYARTYNGSYPAFASWVAFEDLSMKARFRVVNVHTDFRSRSNRLQSVELVAQRAEPWLGAGETVLVVGDMNARHGEKTLRILEDAGFTFAPVSGATYHFNRGLNLFGAIDHIGYAGALAPAGEPVVLRQKFGGEWPTDHYPVLLDLKRKKPN